MKEKSESKINLLTPEEAAEELRSSKQTLARWRLNGIGPAYVRIGGQIRYREQDIIDFINKGASSKRKEKS